jgi:Fe-S cluster assembly protein SufD
MSAPVLTTDHSRAVLDGEHAHGTAPAASRAERVTSFDIADFPMPTGREEDWRFTPIRRMKRLLTEGELSDFGWAIAGGSGGRCDPIDREDAIARAVRAPGDRAGALAVAGADEALALTLPAGIQGDNPLIVKLFDGDGDAIAAHLIIEVGAGSSETIIIEHSGSRVADWSEFISVNVADGAELNLVVLQLWGDDVVYAGEIVARVGAGAHLRSAVVSLGGDLVRLNTSAAFAGEDGTIDLFGLYFAAAGQHLEHRIFVDHAAPRCRSRVTYKGALQGKNAHTVWVGDVLIRAEAEGTDTYELNRNLVLTDGARADSIPNLEIETGLIDGAGHASATGRFDDEQIFYLQSRGIPEAEARRLVVRGFFAELVEQIGVAAVQERVLKLIEAELEKSI